VSGFEVSGFVCVCVVVLFCVCLSFVLLVDWLKDLLRRWQWQAATAKAWRDCSTRAERLRRIDLASRTEATDGEHNAAGSFRPAAPIFPNPMADPERHTPAGVSFSAPAFFDSPHPPPAVCGFGRRLLFIGSPHPPPMAGHLVCPAFSRVRYSCSPGVGASFTGIGQPPERSGARSFPPGAPLHFFPLLRWRLAAVRFRRK
jgi:hypothetical protein